MKIESEMRQARSQDMAACAEIYNGWIDETQWMPRIHSQNDVQDYYKNTVLSARQTMVIVAGRDVAGFISGGADKLVTALYVKPTYRRQGVGRKLLNKLKQDLGAGLHLYTFQENFAAIAFYQREGFVEVNRTDGDNEEGLPDILFEWRGDLKEAVHFQNE
jgi:ribosomal protein S18 acetylase RimI-like enzyme